MPDWYYVRDGQRQGPVQLPQLKQLAAGGSLRPDDLVWNESMPSWSPARSVGGLFPGPTAAMPAPARGRQPPPVPPAGATAARPPLPGRVQASPIAAPFVSSGAPPPDAARGGQSLARHIPLVGILLMVQGGLECAVGSIYVLILIDIVTGGNVDSELSPVIGSIIAALMMGVGGFRIFAGAMNYQFRGRVLGIVALTAGMATLITLFCLPTAIALAIFGLIVFVNKDSAPVFALRSQGYTREQVRATLR
jgi:hypothetical protein